MRHTERTAVNEGYFHVLLRPIEEVIYGLENDEPIIAAIYTDRKGANTQLSPKYVYVWQWCVQARPDRLKILGINSAEVEQINEAIHIASNGNLCPSKGAVKLDSAFRAMLESHNHDYGEDYVTREMERMDVLDRLEAIEQQQELASAQLEQPNICEGHAGVIAKMSIMRAQQGVLRSRLARF